jgi:hypothetical protein
MIDKLIANLLSADVALDRVDDVREFIDDDQDGAARAKLADAMLPGYPVEFDPAEAERAGAFTEDAIGEADALASSPDAFLPVLPPRTA